MKQNDVVWAKIKGFPWWPGVISSISKSKEQSIEYLVNFQGDFTYARLPDSKLYIFQEKFKEFSNRKNKKLSDAIQIAEKILSGETNFAVEQRKLEKKSEIKKDQKINAKIIENEESSSKDSEEDTVENQKKSPKKIPQVKKIVKEDNSKPKNRAKILRKKLVKKSYIRRSSRSNIKLDPTASNVKETHSQSSDEDNTVEKLEIVKNKIGRPKKSNIVNNQSNNERKKFYELEQFYQKTFNDILDLKSQKKDQTPLQKIVKSQKRNLLQNSILPKISKTELFSSKIGKYVMSIKLILEKYQNLGDFENASIFKNVIQLMDGFVSTLGKAVVNQFFEFDDLLSSKENVQKKNIFENNKIPTEHINKKQDIENSSKIPEKIYDIENTKKVDQIASKKFRTPAKDAKATPNNDKVLHEEFMKEKDSVPSDYKNYLDRGMDIEPNNNRKPNYDKGYTRSGRNNNPNPIWTNEQLKLNSLEKNNQKQFMNSSGKKKREERFKKGASENNEKRDRSRSSSLSESISKPKKGDRSRSRSLARSHDNCKKTKDVNFSYKANTTNLRSNPKNCIFDSMKPSKKTTNDQIKNETLKTQDDKNLNYYSDKAKNIIDEKEIKEVINEEKDSNNISEDFKNSTKSSPVKDKPLKKHHKPSKSVDNNEETNDLNNIDASYNIVVNMLVPVPSVVESKITESNNQNKKAESVNCNPKKPQDQVERKLFSNTDTIKTRNQLKVPTPQEKKKDKKKTAITHTRDVGKKPLSLIRSPDAQEDYATMKPIVLKKIARALIQQFSLSKKDSESIAINLENKNRASYIKDPNNLENYKHEIVNLIKSIQNKTLDQCSIMVKQEPSSLPETMELEEESNMIFKDNTELESSSYQNL